MKASDRRTYARGESARQPVHQRAALTASRVALRWELPDAHHVSDAVTTRHAIWQLLATLPDKQRAAVILRYLHDTPDAQTAQALGCREATVRSLVSRGIATLRQGHAAATAPEGGLR